MVARIRRDGVEWEQRFRRGKATTPLKNKGGVRGHGTTLTFHPDPDVFPSITFKPERIAERLESKAYLHKGLMLVFRNEANGQTQQFLYQDGLKAYLRKLIANSDKKAVIQDIFHIERNASPPMECVLTWTESPEERLHSFVNGIPTPFGGTHETGLKNRYRQGRSQLH